MEADQTVGEERMEEFASDKKSFRLAGWNQATLELHSEMTKTVTFMSHTFHYN